MPQFRGPPCARGVRRRFVVHKRAITSAPVVSGQTLDSSGAPLAGCTVDLYLTATKTLVATQLSDASGNYSFPVPADANAYFVNAYLAGSPDVEGTTVNTLTGTQPAGP